MPRRRAVVTGAVVLAVASTSAVAVAATYERPDELRDGRPDRARRAARGHHAGRAPRRRAPSSPPATAPPPRATASSCPRPGRPSPSSRSRASAASCPPTWRDEWWALSDNGYGARANSADYELAVYRVRPSFGTSPTTGGVEVVGGFTLSDPDDHVGWQTVCDPTGTPLPPLAGNALPAVAPAVCAGGDRVLTGFDFDPESVQVAADGTFWFGEELGALPPAHRRVRPAAAAAGPGARRALAAEPPAGRGGGRAADGRRVARLRGPGRLARPADPVRPARGRGDRRQPERPADLPLRPAAPASSAATRPTGPRCRPRW